jgi:hypothetical protein
VSLECRRVRCCGYLKAILDILRAFGHGNSRLANGPRISNSLLTYWCYCEATAMERWKKSRDLSSGKECIVLSTTMVRLVRSAQSNYD